jgi:ABC-type nitrate/sulfonate/bicarbonate transport system substrate-binding protein
MNIIIKRVKCIMTKNGISKIYAVIIILILVVAVTASLVYYYYYMQRPVERISITIAVTHPEADVESAIWFVPIYKGLFEKYGLNVEYLDVAGGSGECIRLLIEGSVDVAFIASYTMLAPRAEGADVRIVASLTFGSVPLGVIVPPDSPIKSYADLKGKSVGVSRPGSGSYIGAKVIMYAMNFTENDMNIVPLGSLDAILAALKKGQIDAGVWTITQCLLLEQKGEFRSIKPFINTLVPHANVMPGRVLITTPQYAKNNPEAIKRLINVFVEAAKIWKENKKWVYDAILMNASLYALSEPLADFMYNEHIRVVEDCGIYITGVQAMIDVFREVGVYSGELTVDDIIIRGFVPIHG